MDDFNYKNGRLQAEEVSIAAIAAEVGTPTYVYCKATFLDHLRKIEAAYRELDTTVCYSVKACGNINILKFLAASGSGFDIVSGGELFRVRQSGSDMSKIVYAGVGKTDSEITEALNAGIGYFNIESEAELKNLIVLAKKAGRKTKAALRVNPDVDPKTHKYITTGKKESKFGVDIEWAQKIFSDYAGNGWVGLCAIHIHLGSGGRTVDPYREAVEKILPVINKLRSAGHNIEMLDLGGGYGADYESDTVPSARDYAGGVVSLLKDRGLKLILEPGKSIAANAGILLTRVLYVKKGGEKKFVIVDAGMNDLIRPPLYGAFHFIWPEKVESRFASVKRSRNIDIKGLEFVDIVGPICESADFFAKDRAIPPVERGDLLCIFSAGAYGFSMASNYNSRPMAAEVLVDGGEFTVIRRRQSYDEMVSPEKPV